MFGVNPAWIQDMASRSNLFGRWRRTSFLLCCNLRSLFWYLSRVSLQPKILAPVGGLLLIQSPKQLGTFERRSAQRGLFRESSEFHVNGRDDGFEEAALTTESICFVRGSSLMHSVRPLPCARVADASWQLAGPSHLNSLAYVLATSIPINPKLATERGHPIEIA